MTALLGNHDVLLLAARRFGRDGPVDFLARWRENEGSEEDLANLTPRHVAWLEDLPAMVLTENALLIHADAALYESHGESVEKVNASFATILKRNDANAFHRLLDAFGEHNAFRGEEGAGAGLKGFCRFMAGKRLSTVTRPSARGGRSRPRR